MYAISLLERWLSRNCASIHAGRRQAAVRAVTGIIEGGRAILTEIGRHLKCGRDEKHRIKNADRLIGNRHLHAERLVVYRALAHWLLSQTPRPFIIVDWSDVQLSRRQLMLKAAVPVGGRALTLYEEVHPLKRYNSPKTHRKFLERLHAVVPPGCHPILITDAGFRGPWFEAVAALGWDWIGRVRNRVTYRLAGASSWSSLRSLHAQATSTPHHVGSGWLSATRPYACELYLYQGFKRGPGRPRKPLRACPNQRRKRRAAREPWVLATSLPAAQWSARRIVSAYQKRMQIEETFRDLKSHRWGLSLQYARSRSSQRLENLLLLASLATLATWLAGLAVRLANLATRFHANTVKVKNVLSNFFLGRRALKSEKSCLSPPLTRNALQALPFIVNQQASWL